MNKRTEKRWIFGVLSAALAAHFSFAHAVTIAEVISPTCVVLAQGDARKLASFGGKPVFWCGLQAFEKWATVDLHWKRTHFLHLKLTHP
jgi:hypothetical protein